MALPKSPYSSFGNTTNYNMFLAKRQEMDGSGLFKRMDDDKKLAILDPYQMKNLDGQPTPDVINVTMNEARVFLDRSGAIMNGANMQRIVFGKGLNDKDTTTIENFFEDIYYVNDLMVANAFFTSLYGFLIEQILVRGAICSRVLMREDGDKFLPDISPVDTRYFMYETDSQGIIWGAPEITRSRVQIERDYGIVIRAANARVVDLWDDKVNEIYIGAKLYKGGSQTNDSTKYPERQREHGLGYPPFIFQKSGAGLQSLMDIGGLKYQGESIFAANRGLIPELHRAASILQTLTAMSFEGSLVANLEDPNEGDPLKSPYGLRKITELGANEKLTLVPITDVRNATRLFYNMLVGALQRGGLPNIDYGALSFPLSAVAISKLTASKDAIFIPRLNAMALFYRAMSQMIKKQYVQAGYHVEIGEEGSEREYAASEIDKKFATKYEFHSISPEQNIANMAIGQQAKALGYSTHTVFQDIMKLDNPTGEIMKARAERGEAGDIAQTLYLVGHQQIDDGKDFLAKMTLQQLVMVLRNRAMGGSMGLEPAKGGLGAGQSVKPLVNLFDKTGGGGKISQEEEMRSPEESERLSERRETVVRKSREES